MNSPPFAVGDRVVRTFDARPGIVVHLSPPIVRLEPPIHVYVTIWNAAHWRVLNRDYEPTATVNEEVVRRVREYRSRAEAGGADRPTGS
jgi:hypothetical protein